MKTNPLNESEIAELRSILADRAPCSGADLANAYRAGREMERQDIEFLKTTFWDLVLGKTKLDLDTFTRLLQVLGLRVEHLEAGLRAVEMQRRAEAQREADRKQREAILERAKPAQQALDDATKAIFGADVFERVNSGDLVQAPYLVDLEKGTVTTIVEALRAPCAELEKALAGIDSVFRYGWQSAPTFLADQREVIDRAVAAHVERQQRILA